MDFFIFIFKRCQIATNITSLWKTPPPHSRSFPIQWQVRYWRHPYRETMQTIDNRKIGRKKLTLALFIWCPVAFSSIEQTTVSLHTGSSSTPTTSEVIRSIISFVTSLSLLFLTGFKPNSSNAHVFKMAIHFSVNGWKSSSLASFVKPEKQLWICYGNIYDK